MNPRSSTALLLAVMLGQTGAGAQLTLALPEFQVAGAIAGLPGTAGGLEVDRFGHAYVLSQPQGMAGSIIQVRADGTVDPNYAAPLGLLSQLALNPLDGQVYAAAHSVTGPPSSAVFLLLPQGGAISAGVVPLNATGFAIDNLGRWILGTTLGPQGAGVYRHDPSGPGGNLSLLTAGTGSNAILQSLISGDVLIAEGTQVVRWVPGSSATLPYFQLPPPLPNQFLGIVSLSRSPFNRFGPGAFLAVRELTTLCLCGTSQAVFADLAGQNSTTLVSEVFPSPGGGVVALAAGPGQDLWWLTQSGSAAALHRIQALPAAGVAGSLLLSTAPGQATVDLYGPVPGALPFLLGFVLTPPAGSISLFAGPHGLIELNPFSPAYGKVVDGVGLLGPPDPAGTIPAGGHTQLVAAIPSGLSGITLDLQALILSAQAPNGFFFQSPRAPLTLP